MPKISYRRHRLPQEISQHAVWLYFRFPLSFRDVEDLLAERRFDNASDECNGSSRPDQPKDFCPLTPPSTTPNAI